MNETSISSFLTTVKEGSFSKAAERLYMTRQAVSKQVAHLERELQTALFVRETASLSLTEAGQLYEAYFRHAYDEVNKAREAVSKLVAAHLPLVIGCIHDFELRGCLDAGMQHCLARNKSVSFRWERWPPELLMERIADGALDLGIVYADYAAAYIERGLTDALPLCTTQSVLAYHSGYPLPDGMPVTPALLAAEPCFVTALQHDSIRTAELFRRYWQKRCGLAFTDIRVLPNYDSVLLSCRLQQGVALIRDRSELLNDPNMRSCPLGVHDQVVAVWRKNNDKHCLMELTDYLYVHGES